MRKLIIFGFYSYSDSIISLCNKIGGIEIIAICVDDEYLISLPMTYKGIRLIGFNEGLELYSDVCYVLAIGYKNMRKRKSIYERFKAHDLEIATLISPNAHISTDYIAPGCVIFDGVVIEQGVVINENVTIWSNATICHDVKISSHSFISANSTLGGFAKIGSLSFIGFNATVLDSIEVGNECLIGACSLINFNVIDFSKCYGVPAKYIDSIDKELGVSV